MILRPATPLDAGAMGQILSDWIEATPWMPRLHTRAETIGFCGHMIDRGWVQVAESDALDGFLARDGDYIHALYIREGARGLGRGSALLQVAMGAARRLALNTFQSNLQAQTFYEGHGFCAVKRSDGAGNDEGLPDIRYEWEVA